MHGRALCHHASSPAFADIYLSVHRRENPFFLGLALSDCFISINDSATCFLGLQFHQEVAMNETYILLKNPFYKFIHGYVMEIFTEIDLR